MKIAAGLLGACLALAACSGPGPAAPTVTVTAPATPPTVPSADPATQSWVDGFCSAVYGYQARTNAEAGKSPQPSSPAEAQKALSAELGGFAARTGEVVARLTALPPSAVPLAETVRKSYVTKFTTARDRAADAKAKLDRAEPADDAAQAAAGDAIGLVQQDLDGTYDAVSPLLASPQLTAAAISAPGCKP
jgi:hypothetical protein